MEKGKRKENGVPVTRSVLSLFLSHRHVILSRGTQWNRQKLSECSNPMEIILFPVVSAWSDIRPRWTFSSDSRDIAASPGWTYPTPSRIYMTSRIYPASFEF
jgi:hypothetical protein